MCDDDNVRSYFHKTLVSTSVQAEYITVLSSKRNSNHFHIQEKNFMISRTSQFGVLLAFNLVGAKNTA